ncbi:hypothetical protein CBR_g55882 [Chara braunii]|uniref:Uncharacterized protein n=1 Tax=Chara braunii TaxID=69332 RepID=A0A388MDA9_CHABU|nr:hypothetical protein CBR_g55882 [Chara braunii]|eukprot:GBG92547.1 hypothetical protein CBR_g55882 [Chara braunii]
MGGSLLSAIAAARGGTRLMRRGGQRQWSKCPESKRLSTTRRRAFVDHETSKSAWIHYTSSEGGLPTEIYVVVGGAPSVEATGSHPYSTRARVKRVKCMKGKKETKGTTGMKGEKGKKRKKRNFDEVDDRDEGDKTNVEDEVDEEE